MHLIIFNTVERKLYIIFLLFVYDLFIMIIIESCRYAHTRRLGMSSVLTVEE